MSCHKSSDDWMTEDAINSLHHGTYCTAIHIFPPMLKETTGEWIGYCFPKVHESLLIWEKLRNPFRVVPVDPLEHDQQIHHGHALMVKERIYAMTEQSP